MLLWVGFPSFINFSQLQQTIFLDVHIFMDDDKKLVPKVHDCRDWVQAWVGLQGIVFYGFEERRTRLEHKILFLREATIGLGREGIGRGNTAYLRFGQLHDIFE